MNEILLETLKRTKYIKFLIALYFLVALIEIIAEYNLDFGLIYLTKPLLMPILIILYWCASKNVNYIFIVALITVWFANLFFIGNEFNNIVLGGVFFLVYRILIIVLVIKTVKFPGYIPIMIGSFPFLFLYLFVTNLAFIELGKNIYMFLIQGVFMIFFGGYCLGNYFIKPNKSNTYLLISALLFTAIQFVLVIKLLYISYNIIQPLAMILFVFGQYLLYQFMIYDEKKKTRYEIINKYKELES